MSDEKKQKHLTHLGLRALANMLFGRSQLAEKLGHEQFGGARDLYKTFGYRKILVFRDFLSMYKRGDLAGRIVDSYPDSTWAEGVKVEDEFASNQDSQFETAFAQLAERLKLFHVLRRADILAQLGRYSVIFIGVAGQKDLQNPLRMVRSWSDVIYLSVFSEECALVHDLVDDPTDHNYGKPRLYKLSIATPDGKTGQSVLVHRSRVLHVADNVLDDETYGTPRLQRVFNKLEDLAKITGGSAELFWLAANRGLHIDVNSDMDLDETDEKELASEVEEYVHGLTRVIKSRGTRVTSLGSDTINPAQD